MDNYYHDEYVLPNGEIWYTENQAPGIKFSYEAEILASEGSDFQKMTVMKNRQFGTFFTLDGFVQVTEKDEFIYHEMITHPALAVNPDISRVLIIGGGDGGTAREVLRYQHLSRIDMVEIDEMVVRLSKKYLPSTACSFANPRLNLTIGDGLKFVEQAADNAYDLILVDSTDPIGPGEGLFTNEFYRNCYRVLSDKGILINQQEGAFYDEDFHEMQRAHEKIAATFPIARLYGFNIPSYCTGYWYFGFASKALDPVKDQQADRWERFGLTTKYYNSALHSGAFALPTYVLNKLAGKGEA